MLLFLHVAGRDLSHVSHAYSDSQAAIAGQGVVLASWPILKSVVNAGLLVKPFEETVTTDIGCDIVTTQTISERTEVGMFVSWILEASYH